MGWLPGFALERSLRSKKSTWVFKNVFFNYEFGSNIQIIGIEVAEEIGGK